MGTLSTEIKNYLSDHFWQDPTPHVMVNPRTARQAVELQNWLEQRDTFENHIFFQTSGSTGRAKWVALHKSAILHSAKLVNQHFNIPTSAAWTLALPIYHVGGFGVIARSFILNSQPQIHNSEWCASNFTQSIQTDKSYYISLVPTQIADLVSGQHRAPQNVAAVIVGGGKLSDSLYHSARELGWPAVRSYGMTEASSQIASGDTGDGWLRILQGWKLRLTPQGNLQWKGKAGMSSYIHQTKEGFCVENPLNDGWFTTNDKIELKQGKLKFLGRSDQLVKILGELVNLAELEEKLYSALGRTCVIVDIEDRRRGSRLFPVIEGGLIQPDLTQFTGIHTLEPVQFLEHFPRTDLGKIKRAEIRSSIITSVRDSG